ncbi:MAG: hypothetical protein AB7I35_21695 [Ramlibacter sp.]
MATPSKDALILAQLIAPAYPANAAMLRGLAYDAGAQVKEAQVMAPDVRQAVQAAALELGGAWVQEWADSQTPAQQAANEAFIASKGLFPSWETAIDWANAGHTPILTDAAEAYGIGQGSASGPGTGTVALWVLGGAALIYFWGRSRR